MKKFKFVGGSEDNLTGGDFGGKLPGDISF